MPIITVTVENADELLNGSYLGTGALIRVERSATGGGVGYSEITTTALVAGTRVYTIYDLAGAVSSWYRIRYSKSDGTSPSEYGDEFQAGGEEGGLLCSLYDVGQRLGGFSTDSDRDTALELIRAMTTAIEGYTGRWFNPRPLQGSATYRTHTRNGRVVRFPKGIREITSLGAATTDQPASGGSYDAITGGTYYVDPPEIERSAGWPGLAVRLLSSSTQRFYTASFGAEITGKFGWSAPPPDIADIAANAVIRKFIGKERAEPTAFVGPSGGVTLLRDISPSDMNKLAWYRVVVGRR